MKRLSLNKIWSAAIATVLLALMLAATGAFPGGKGGGKVTVTAAVPSDAFQGEELDVIVVGTGFDAGTTVSYLVTGTTDASQIKVLMVQYISAKELRTRIRPRATAPATDYDIEVRTGGGRKGKGTTLFRVKKGPPPPSTQPTEPSARGWHAFTDNGSTAPDASRLYVFGGTGGYENGWQLVAPDLWYFSVNDAKWNLAPTGLAVPSARAHVGLSCGAGRCVAANGTRLGALKETWVYSETIGAWSQLNCKRNLCPSARWAPTIAYDSARFYHLLFGGEASGTGLGDTYTFANATGQWTRQSPAVSPPPRRSAAAAFVAGPVNRVVLFGGLFPYSEIYCDMWSWTGSNWKQIIQINGQDGPCLRNHSMAWDGARLVVTGGYVAFNGDIPNDAVWTFTFTPDGKAGTWSYYPDWYAYFSECAGSPVIRPGALMAFDRPSGFMVFFGGEENVAGLGMVAYDDLTVCH